jgi:hypothetical protein
MAAPLAASGWARSAAIPDQGWTVDIRIDGNQPLGGFRVGEEIGVERRQSASQVGRRNWTPSEAHLARAAQGVSPGRGAAQPRSRTLPPRPATTKVPGLAGISAGAHDQSAAGGLSPAPARPRCRRVRVHAAGEKEPRPETPAGEVCVHFPVLIDDMRSKLMNPCERLRPCGRDLFSRRLAWAPLVTTAPIASCGIAESDWTKRERRWPAS